MTGAESVICNSLLPERQGWQESGASGDPLRAIARYRYGNSASLPGGGRRHWGQRAGVQNHLLEKCVPLNTALRTASRMIQTPEIVPLGACYA
jgi:hypothetical protein